MVNLSSVLSQSSTVDCFFVAAVVVARRRKRIKLHSQREYCRVGLCKTPLLREQLFGVAWWWWWMLLGDTHPGSSC